MTVALTMTADALFLDELAARLDRARFSPATLRGVEAVRALVTRYFEEQTAFEDRLNVIQQDSSLSAVGQARKQDEEKEQWAADAERLLDDLEARAEKLVKDAEAQLTPPKLAADESAAQARLAAAERHLLMLVQDVHVARLPDELRELGGSKLYPDVAYLVGATPFASMMLRARGAHADAERFEADRRELLRPILPPEGVQALDDLPGLQDAASLAPALRGVHQGFRYRYAVRDARVGTR